MGKDTGQIHLDPLQLRRQVHPIRTRIEARGKIYNHIYTLLTLFCDESVKQVCPRHPSPSIAIVEGHGIGDLIAAFPSEPARKGIAEERVFAFGLSRAIDR